MAGDLKVPLPISVRMPSDGGLTELLQTPPEPGEDTGPSVGQLLENLGFSACFVGVGEVAIHTPYPRQEGISSETESAATAGPSPAFDGASAGQTAETQGAEDRQDRPVLDTRGLKFELSDRSRSNRPRRTAMPIPSTEQRKPSLLSTTAADANRTTTGPESFRAHNC